MEYQPTMTIGMVGNVSDGKSSIVRMLTGTTTARFQKEKEGNRTIQLGYANCRIYQCTSNIYHYDNFLDHRIILEYEHHYY